MLKQYMNKYFLAQHTLFPVQELFRMSIDLNPEDKANSQSVNGGKEAKVSVRVHYHVLLKVNSSNIR
jgi:hypothetical protein